MIGKRLGQYEILEEIGRGGMGIVYRARQISLDRDVALKVLPSDRVISPEALARFEREAKVIAQVGHANIVQIIDVGEHEGTRYIVMEMVRGRTLSELVKAKGAMAPRDAAHVAAQVAAALGCIHAKGYVHRDVKPSNIIVDDELNAKLMDFGVALLADQPEGERLTMTRVSVGTPQYMSPEQVLAREKLDGSSDVYSLGVVLYELLAGKHPWGDATTNEAMIKQVHEALPPIRRYCEGLPDDLEAVLAKCLRKDRKERYADGNALRKDLQRVVLTLEVGGLSKGPVSGEYKARVTESGLFYVDPVARGRAKLLLKMRGFVREMWAAVVDPHRAKRRAFDRLTLETVAARKAYKDLEAHVEELKKRQQHHVREAAKHRQESGKAVAEGHDQRVKSSSEAEAYHNNLALDYEQKARELGRQAETNRSVYDAMKADLDGAADELALLDADARRAGKLVPSGERAAWFGGLGRWLKYSLILAGGLLIAFVLIGTGMALFNMIMNEWRRTAPPPAARPLPPAPAPSPPGATTYNPANGHYYRLVTGRVSWTEAMKASQVSYKGLTGYLVTITSAQENDFVLGLLPADAKSLMIGATDEAQEGQFRWATGEAFSYANWCPGDPDNQRGNENYVYMMGPAQGPTAGTWCDGHNGPHPHNIYYMIEWGKVSTQAGVSSRAPVSAGPPKLVLHYTFDGPTGDRVRDSSGQGNDGRVTGAAWIDDGVSGGAMRFDGDGDYIRIPCSASLEPDEITIAAWLRARQVGPDVMAVVFKKNPRMFNHEGYELLLYNDGTYRLGLASSSGAQDSADTKPIAKETWYHVVATFSRPAIRIYLNGQLAGTGRHDYPLFHDTGRDVFVGATDHATEPLHRFFKGDVDDLRIYDKALGPEEVTDLYASARPPAPSPAGPPKLVLHYSFDRNEGASVIDRSGQGNNGVNHDAVFDTGGAIGGAYRFDGENSYIMVSRSASLNLGNQLTLAAWVKPDDYSDQMPVIDWNNDGPPGIQFWMAVRAYQWRNGGTGAHLVGDDGVENRLERVISVPEPPLGRWHHLAVTYDGLTGRGRLYLDGAVVRDQDMGIYVPQTTFDLYIGHSKGSPLFFKGLIDDVRIYKGVLSAAEIKALAAQGETPAAPPPRAGGGLVLRYSFDRDEGGRVTDESGNGNDATVVGAVHVEDGRAGGAMRFDGRSSLLRLRDSESLRPEHVSVSAWIKPGKRYATKGAVIFSKEQPGGPGGYVLRYLAGGLDFMIMRSGSYEPLRVTTVLESNQWYHVCGTFDGEWQRLYLNGDLTGEVQRQVRISHKGTSPTIGASADPSPRDFFDGVIDDVRVYGRGLSPDEVRALYQQGGRGVD